MTRPADDVRTRITEHAFRLDPSLLGIPLSSPRRRLVALLIDLLAIAILASAPAYVLGIALAVVLLRVAAARGGGLLSRTTRRAARVGLAVIAFAFAVSVWNRVERFAGNDDSAERARPGTGDATEMPPGPTGTIEMDGLRGAVAATALLAFAGADEEAAARQQADRLINILRREGATDADIAGLLHATANARPERPWLAAAADSVALALVSAPVGITEPGIPAEPLVTLVDRWNTALATGDSSGAAAASVTIREHLAGDTIRLLAAAAARERASADRIAAARDEDGSDAGGVLPFVRQSLADLGLGLGWSSLYFTAFLKLWSGQTPGKRLLRIRVVRLDGKPIGWWTGLERFGGYAAGLATGLIGFLQVFWDHNRQAIQDKISETVVVRL